MKRFIYQKLQSWKSKGGRKPLIIKGVRQCGKTYAVLEFAKSFAQCHVINFERQSRMKRVFTEDLSAKRIIQALEFELDISINIDEDLLFFDEIQECPPAISSLKYFCEDLPAMAVCCAGSHIGVTCSTHSFPVGKVEYLNLFPMNFGEFLINYSERIYTSTISMITEGINPLADQKLFEILKYYWLIGGLPEAVNAFLEKKESPRDAILAVREIHMQLINGYTSDFAKHCGGINAQQINLIFQNIPNQLQTLQDGSSKRFQFKGIIPNRSRYSQLSAPIEWLVKSGLALKVNQTSNAVYPINSYTKENFFRLFLFDTGLLSTMLNLRAEDSYGSDHYSYKGFIAENFIAQELNALEIPAYSLNEKRSEVEFIIDYEDQIIPIEVKAGKNMKSQSLSSFKERYHPIISINFSGRPLKYESDQISAPLYLSSFLPQLLKITLKGS